MSIAYVESIQKSNDLLGMGLKALNEPGRCPLGPINRMVRRSYTRRRQGDITSLPSSQLQQFRRLPGDKQAGSICQ